ncbi:MAG: HU family DNA-binding protein [Bacteroidaceae bacterium]|nr:HU family DNA-binding protein [Bacteroidaceae bacterium]MBQ9295249.1 HU family DNA-binding protein [Bacteroidaceae bacterium]
MNNKEFVADMAQRTDLSVKEASSMVSAAVSAIISELMEENTIIVSGFGALEVKKKLERVLVNPTTKQRMLIPPKMVVSFKPYTSLKSKVK